jgi:hypothetical protein
MPNGADSAAILAKLFSQGGGGGDQLKLRGLQEDRLGELDDQIGADASAPDQLFTDKTGRVRAIHDPVSAASILRRGLFKKDLERDMATDPDMGIAAHQDIANNEKLNAQADAYFDPRQTQIRNEQEQFQLRKSAIEHPNPNVSPFLNTGGMPPQLQGAHAITAPGVNADPQADAKFQQFTVDLSPDAQAKIQGLLNYQIPLPAGNALARPEWATVLSRALQIDPTFDVKRYGERQAYLKDYASGQTGRAITSLDTVMHHLDSFNNSATALHNTGLPIYNAFANWMRESTIGFPEKKQFDNDAGAVEGELANVFKATGATDQEIHAWRSRLSSSETPEEFKANVASLVDLINGRMSAVGNRYKSVMGHDAPDFLSPESRAIFNRFSQGGGSQPHAAGPQAAAPRGVNPPMAGAGNGVTVTRIR